MISLREPDAPYTLDLGYGIQVTVKPLTTSSMLVAQAKARQKAEKYQQQAEERTSHGLDDKQDEVDSGENPALYQLYLLQELACSHIIDWQGVSFEGKPAPLTSTNINAVMELYPVGEKFLGEFTLKQMLLNAAKKESGPSANGTLLPAEGPTIAKDATKAADRAEDVPTSDMPPTR